MAEYIDRAALIRIAEQQGHVTVDDIVNEDAADVEEVTRCKDCKHYDMGVCLKIYSDGAVHPEAWQSRKPEDFCSYGERKEGGDDGGDHAEIRKGI